MDKGSLADALTSPSTPSQDAHEGPGIQRMDIEVGPPAQLNPYGDHVFKEGGAKAWFTVLGS